MTSPSYHRIFLKWYINLGRLAAYYNGQKEEE